MSGCSRQQAEVQTGLISAQSKVSPSGPVSSPAELSTELKSSSALITMRSGQQYEADLPNARTTEEGALAMLYSPVGEGHSEIAYGIYSFNIDELSSLSFKAEWSGIGQSAGEGNYYFAISDFSSNRWEWYSPEYRDVVPFSDAHRYRNADGLCLVLIALAGDKPLELYHVGFSSGLLFDEIEPNNSADEAQPLPPAPLYAFRGSLGRSNEYFTGYDGGMYDYFSLSAEEGQHLSIVVLVTGRLNYNSYERVVLSDSTGILFNRNMYEEDIRRATVISDIVYDAAKAPYILELSASYTDYEIYILEDADGVPPEAILSVSPTAGPAPLTVSLDASASLDHNPGHSLVRYDWDFEGDGIWDLLEGTEAVVQHSYEQDGVYYPRVRVGSSIGIGHQDAAYSGTAGRRTVTVGDNPYDEVEDNDDISMPGLNALPQIPFSGYTGNVGYYSQSFGPVYDGDWNDFFVFHAEAGKMHSFLDDRFSDDSVSPDNGSNVHLKILTLAGKHITSINGYEKSISFLPGESADYILKVGAGSNHAGHDYSLRAIHNFPPRIDSVSVDSKYGVVPFTARLTASAHDDDSAELTYGWGLWTSPEPQYGSGSTADIEITWAGSNYIWCFVTDETGLRDTYMTTIYGWTHEYDEREPNNVVGQAQVLPALPFTGFRGSLSGIGKGYDGHANDWFRLAAAFPAGQTLNISASYEPVGSSFDLRLYSASNLLLAEIHAADGTVELEHLVGATESQPYRIELDSHDSNLPNIDYELDVFMQ